MMRLRSYQKILLFLGISASFFMFSGSTNASYGTLPTYLVGPAFQYVNISDVNTSGAFGAFLPTSDTKIYTNQLAGGTRYVSVYIDNLSAGNDCSGYDVYYYVYRLLPDENINTGSPFSASGKLTPGASPASPKCGGPYLIPISDAGLTASSRPDHAGLYTARLRLTIISPGGHTAYMRIIAPSSPDTRIDYVGGGISTIYPWHVSGSPYTLRYKFRPSCDGSNATVPIRWFDDDAFPPTYTSGNQTIPLSVNLNTYNQQGGLVSSADLRGSLSGTNGYSAVGPPGGAWNPNYKYELVFSNVEWGNGIGVQLPFDSGDFEFACPREFNTKGSTQVNIDNAENPTTITATGNIQDDGGETAAPIISASLTVTRNGVAVGPASNVSGSPWGWAGNLTVPNAVYPIPGGARSLGWQAGDEICSRLTWTYGKGSVIPGSSPPDIRRLDIPSRTVTSDSAQCKKITDKPYVSVYNNDIAAGGGGLGMPCSSKPANITANSRNGGSGTQLGAFATGTISGLGAIGGFKSAFLRTTSQPISPNGLTFGNTPALGGYADVDCGTDFYEVDQYEDGDSRKNTFNGATLNIGAPGLVQNGEQTIVTPPTGTLRINGSTSFNVKHSIFVDGDVYISSNIAYGSTSWANIDAIPYFNLVVKGNIYIDPSVTQLDGRYIAQPRSATLGGQIYTCAPGGTKPADDVSGGYLWTNCRAKLTVNGQFIAKRVNFFRSINTISDGVTGEIAGNSRAAEVFNFSPEMYLARPATRPKSTSTSGEYQSISILPPIL